MNTPTTPLTATPRPTLSIYDGVMLILGVGVGVGASVFAISPNVAEFAGSVQWMFGAWGIGVLLALMGALCYAELAAAFPHAGGEYHYLSRAFGKDVGFFFAWTRIGVFGAGIIALAGLTFGHYMTQQLPLGAYSEALYATVVVMIFTAINLAGLKESTRTQNIMAAGVIIGLALIVIAGLSTAAKPPTVPPLLHTGLPPMLGSAVLLVMLALSSWRDTTYLSSEIKGGSRGIVKVLFWALGFMSALYGLLLLAFWFGLGFEGVRHSSSIATDTVRPMLGAISHATIEGLMALAALAAINAAIVLTARPMYALANDWPMLRPIGRWYTGREAPLIGLIVVEVASLLMIIAATLWPGRIQFLLTYTAPVFWFFLMLTGIAFFVLRFKFAHANRPFRTPLYPIVPMLFVVTNAFLLYYSVRDALHHQAIHITAYVMLTGAVAWVLVRLKRS